MELNDSNIFTCSNCQNERKFEINQLIFKIIERTLHNYTKSGFIYPQIASNKDIYFLMYIGSDNQKPELNIITENPKIDF